MSKSEHDHWGELRALRKKLRRATPQARETLWGRYCALSWKLDALITKKYGERCPKCGGLTNGGYGFAFGMGLGAYRFCSAEPPCDWFLKTMDREGMACSSE